MLQTLNLNCILHRRQFITSLSDGMLSQPTYRMNRPLEKGLVLVSSYVIIAQNCSKVIKILRNTVSDKPAYGFLLVERYFRRGNLKEAR